MAGVIKRKPGEQVRLPTFLAGGGEMGQLMSQCDWSGSPLGRPEDWPTCLQTAVGLMLPASVQNVIFWGEDHCALYNEGYMPTLGDKHPHALGRPARENWGELWNEVKPLLDRVRRTGDTVSAKNRRFFIERRGYREEAFFDVAYSPIRDENGIVAGVLCLVNDVTERKRAEIALQASEQRFRALIENSSDGVAVVSSDGQLRYVSPAVKHILGLTPDEVIRRGGTSDLIHPDDQAMVHRRGARLRRPGAHLQLTYRLRHTNGAYRWVAMIATNLQHHPAVSGIVANYRDITEQAEARQQIEDSEARQTFLLGLQDKLRTLTDAGEIKATAARLLGNQLRASRAFYAEIDDNELVIDCDYAVKLPSMAGRWPLTMWGEPTLAAYRRSETVTVDDVHTHPLFSDQDTTAYDEAGFCGGIGVPLVKNGRWRAVLAVTNPQPRTWTSAEVRLVEEVTERTWNMVERINAQEAMRASAEFARSILDSSSDCIKTLDLDGKLLSMNEGGRVCLQVDDLESQLGTSWIDFWKRKMDRDTATKAIAAASKGKNSRFEAFCATMRDGTPKWWDVAVTPIFGADGKPASILAVSRDVTKARQAAEDMRHQHELEKKNVALTKQREELLELNQAKDEFISLASHQLRTPATGVKQYLGMLLEGLVGEMPPEQRAFLEQADESNDRQLRIVDEMLRVARADAGQLRLTLNSTDVIRLVDSIVVEQQPHFKRRGQRLAFRHAAAKSEIPLDVGNMRMVLENLLENAGKYSYPGTETAVTVRRLKHGVRIAVKDQGVGIAKEDMPRLFTKFVRLYNPLSVSAGGTGLGLYWGKKIVDLHGGVLKVTSVPGKGSVFTITLPLTTSE